MSVTKETIAVKKSRGFCLTINNYSNEDIYNFERPKFKEQCEYYVYGKEIGTSGTRHLQCYIYYINAKTIAQVSKQHPRAHIEPAKGTPLQASTYCKKDGDFIESGELPIKGKRTDLDDIRNEILNGKKVDDIAIERPAIYHQYGRTLNKLEDIVMRKNIRNEMTKGIWIYGSTGTGKSHRAFEDFNSSTHYVWKFDTDNMWNDDYQQQEIVILDEFRGQMRYADLLRMLDKWPNFDVKRRGRSSIPFNSKTVIITSSLHPSEVYKNLSVNDSLDQLYRRLTIVNMDETT